jgi:hypothetical protein
MNFVLRIDKRLAICGIMLHEAIEKGGRHLLLGVVKILSSWEGLYHRRHLACVHHHFLELFTT